jgi:Flp pilus assembly protein TadB
MFYLNILFSLAVAIAVAAGALVLLGYIHPKPPPPADEIAPPKNFILDSIALDLNEAGIDLTPSKFIMYSLFLGVFVGLFIQVAFNLPIIAVAAGLFLTVAGLRIFYIGRLASKRRKTQMEHIVVAAREVANLIRANNSPDQALELYAAQATSEGVESLTREKNQIAQSLARALKLRVERGWNIEDALRESADQLGNAQYRNFVETYIRNERLDREQTAKALNFFADSVYFKIALRRSLQNAMGIPLMSYLAMGILSPGLVIYMILNLPAATTFWFSSLGQLVALVLVAYWYLGYWLQRRPLNKRY